jgi:RNA polymerase sigma-70 factor (ECF subfamily)
VSEHASNHPSRSDQTRLSLLERVLNRDEQAWQKLVYLYNPLVIHLCRRWSIVGADAEDIAQEVFQAVSVDLGKYQRERSGQKRAFRSWLGGIIHNKMVDFFRRRERQPQAQGGSDAYERLQDLATFDAAVEETEAVGGVCQRALELIRNDFEEQTWQAFWRTSVDRQSAPDVAAELGMSAAAVRKAKSRILHRLKQELGDLVD